MYPDFTTLSFFSSMTEVVNDELSGMVNFDLDFWLLYMFPYAYKSYDVKADNVWSCGPSKVIVKIHPSFRIQIGQKVVSISYYL